MKNKTFLIAYVATTRLFCPVINLGKKRQYQDQLSLTLVHFNNFVMHIMLSGVGGFPLLSTNEPVETRMISDKM